MILELYVPDDGSWADESLVRETLTNVIGGLTEYRATGRWRHPMSGEIAVEPVTVLRVVASRERLYELTAYGKMSAMRIKSELSQTCVLYTIDGEPYYV